ncbi:MAG: hypothetical protein OEU86_06255 [Gammaproteobacteria bacterium]|nr:hypothetical protein [Gammaproteobacteria bacterium]
MQTVLIKEFPKLQATLKKAIPGYRKHKAMVVATDTVIPTGTCWSGGSRVSYLLVTIDGRNVRHMPAPTAPTQFGGSTAEDCRHSLLNNEIALSVGTFNGRTAMVTVYGNSTAVSRLLG